MVFDSRVNHCTIVVEVACRFKRCGDLINKSDSTCRILDNLQEYRGNVDQKSPQNMLHSRKTVEPHRLENTKLLLVTGQGRSGTTVLTKAVAEHPEIYSNRVESNVMKDVLLAGQASSTMPSRIKQMVLPRVQHDLVFRRMLLSLLFPFNDDDKEPTAISTFSAMNPAAAEFAIAVFPGIHFANIVRNGIEVVASRMMHRVFQAHPFENQCLAWAASLEMAKWGADREDFSLIRHESLLNHEACVTTFENLFQKVGLQPSSSVAEYVSQTQKNQTVLPEEDNPTLENRSERWNHWTAEQKRMFVELCGEAMDYFGYQVPS